MCYSRFVDLKLSVCLVYQRCFNYGITKPFFFSFFEKIKIMIAAISIEALKQCATVVGLLT